MQPRTLHRQCYGACQHQYTIQNVLGLASTRPACAPPSQTRSTIQIVTAPVWGVRFSVCLVAERCGVPGSLSLSALLSHNGDVCACVGQPRPNGAAVSSQCQHERKASSPAVLRGSPEPGMRSRRMKNLHFFKTKRTAKKNSPAAGCGCLRQGEYMRGAAAPRLSWSPRRALRGSRDLP